MPVAIKLSPRLLVTLVGLTACLTGCERDEDVRVYAAPRDPAPPVRSAAERPIAWTLPAGWQELPDQGPNAFGRFATIQPSADDPSLVLTVNQVTSGDLLANLNRWEGQLGLDPTAQANVEQKARVIQVEAHPAHRIDLVGRDMQREGEPPLRMLAVLLPEGDGAWSFLLKGPPEKLAAQEAAFDQFIASVSFPGHNHGDEASAGPAAPTADAAATGASTQPADTRTYTLKNVTLPAGWVEDPTPRELRFTTYNIGAGNEQASVVVTRLPRTFGSLADNINRWRGEVGLPPAPNAADVPFGVTRVGGEPAALYEFAPPDAAAGDAKRSVVALVPKGTNAWFFKLIGPAKTVADQRANFDAFLQSLQFGEAGE